jgi:formamidopyrimidine-DNA glycosylase
MPELPEVETMVRGLRGALEGRVIRSVEVRDPFLLQGCTARQFERRGSGALVSAIDRRGKWVVMTLGAGRGMIVIQPRMTGGFRLAEPERPEHIRIVFVLRDPGEFVWFCDTRRLGKVSWYKTPSMADQAFAKAHGPDALHIEAPDLAARLARTKRPIKPALMDQKVLAGIGNIYADEILFRARIHPERVAATLTAAELLRVHAAIAPVLQEAIAAEGASFDGGYRTVLGLEGGFLAQNAMYGRGGQPCPSCGDLVKKTRIAGLIGRPTYFCPTCQLARRHRGRQGLSGRGNGDKVR